MIQGPPPRPAVLAPAASAPGIGEANSSPADRAESCAVRTDSLRFPKEHRLLRSAEYRRVLRTGRRWFTPNFIVYALFDGRDHRRLGITVSKKVGNSPVRSRVRRCVREAFRLHPEWLSQSADVVVVAKNPPKGQPKRRRGDFSTAQVARELGYALRRCSASPTAGHSTAGRRKGKAASAHSVTSVEVAGTPGANPGENSA